MRPGQSYLHLYISTLGTVALSCRAKHLISQQLREWHTQLLLWAALNGLISFHNWFLGFSHRRQSRQLSVSTVIATVLPLKSQMKTNQTKTYSFHNSFCTCHVTLKPSEDVHCIQASILSLQLSFHLIMTLCMNAWKGNTVFYFISFGWFAFMLAF